MIAFNNGSESEALKPRSIQFFERYILPYWWVVLFLILCYIPYERSVNRLNEEYAKLRRQLIDLKIDKQKALVVQEDYLLQINSQSDLEWVELTLMKGLDLVPEDQVKVFFSSEAKIE